MTRLFHQPFLQTSLAPAAAQLPRHSVYGRFDPSSDSQISQARSSRALYEEGRQRHRCCPSRRDRRLAAHCYFGGNEQGVFFFYAWLPRGEIEGGEPKFGHATPEVELLEGMTPSAHLRKVDDILRFVWVGSSTPGWKGQAEEALSSGERLAGFPLVCGDVLTPTFACQRKMNETRAPNHRPTPAAATGLHCENNKQQITKIKTNENENIS